MNNKPRKKQRIEFVPEDFGFLDTVLRLQPELRICALALKRAKLHKLSFPVNNPTDILHLLPEGEIAVEGHVIDHSAIQQYMVKELFPIRNEDELALRVYGALLRCREDENWASRAPANYESLLSEQRLSRAKEA